MGCAQGQSTYSVQSKQKKMRSKQYPYKDNVLRKRGCFFLISVDIFCLFPDVVDNRLPEQVDSHPDNVDSVPNFVDIFLKVLTTENSAVCKVRD